MVLRYVGKIPPDPRLSHQYCSGFHLLFPLQPPFAEELVKTLVDFVQQINLQHCANSSSAHALCCHGTVYRSRTEWSS